MWELLQKLEKLGWKPYGKSIAELTETEKNVRLLTSRSSGLWQFVCENGMVYEQVLGWEEYHWAKCTADKELREHYSTYSLEYEYRLIESALKDESELENFILENIKL